MNNLKEYMGYWSKLESQIQEKNNDIRKLREQKDLINKKITEYLLNINMTDNIFKINNEHIKFKKINTKEPLSQGYIKKQLLEYFKEKELSEKLYNHIIINRQTKTSYTLSKIDKKHI